MSERRYRLLGGLRVEVDGSPVDLGTVKPRALLAVLLLARCRAVSLDQLVEDVWGAGAPDRVEASVQSYVSSLRRALEPDRPPRGPATALVTRGTSYALLAEPDDVDVWRFTDLVHEARRHVREGEHGRAADVLAAALGLYAPLLPEFDGEPFHAAAAEHLAQLHLSALELSYEVRLALGEHQQLLPDLEDAVRRHPLHEGLWATLAVARYRAGRQADALQAVADCKRLLADEVGVDPSPRLRELESDLLAQAPYLDPPAAAQVGAATATAPAQAVQPPAAPLVGRGEELAVLQAAVADAVIGRDRVVLVEGEPGVGKTRLLEEVAGRGHRPSGVCAVWGRCVEGDGAPSLWPWLQILGDAVATVDASVRDRVAATELGRLLDPSADDAQRPAVLPDSGARFRLFDQAAQLLADIAGAHPLVVVLDDLQWADRSSLDLLVHVASARLPRVVLLAGMRDRAPVPSSDLSTALGTLSRLPSHRRLRLGALGADEVAALIEQQTGDRPSSAVAATIQARTEGNPFFVRELARLLHDEGLLDDAAVTAAGVPSGVRDVVRGRIEAAGSRDLLELAAVLGRDVELDLLARAASTSIDDALTRLEGAVDLGLVGPHPEDPFAFRFSHDLVRESIVESVAPYQAVRLHLAVADALDAAPTRRADRAERLAHHLWSAGPLAAPARTASALLAAGRLALQRYAYDDARRHLELASLVAESGGEPEIELEIVALLTSVIGVQQGYVGSTLDLLERAERLAISLGQQRRAADFLYTRWAAHSQGIDLPHAARLAERLYRQALASDDPLIRVYGHHAKGVDAWDHGRIGESFRALLDAEAALADQLSEAESEGEQDLLRYDLQLLVPAFLGFMTVVHGDLEGGRDRFDRMAATVGAGPYPMVVWAAFAGISAAFAHDHRWARTVAEQGIAADEQFDFVFLGTYVRIIAGWARAVQGEDPRAAVEEIQALLDSMPKDQPRSGEGAWWSLFAEACLAAGQPERALTALEHAARAMAAHGQVYPEPLRLLVLARCQHALGEPAEVVAGTLARVRADATEREAFLLVTLADEAEVELLGQAPSTRSR